MHVGQHVAPSTTRTTLQLATYYFLDSLTADSRGNFLVMLDNHEEAQLVRWMCAPDGGED